MASTEEANEAIKMFNGSQLGGRTMKVNFPEIPRGGERAVVGPRIRRSSRAFVDTPYKIYAGNLAWTLTSDGLRSAFEAQSGLVGAKVVYERDSGKSRGFGFVSFQSREDAESALANVNGAVSKLPTAPFLTHQELQNMESEFFSFLHSSRIRQSLMAIPSFIFINSMYLLVHRLSLESNDLLRRQSLMRDQLLSLLTHLSVTAGAGRKATSPESSLRENHTQCTRGGRRFR